MSDNSKLPISVPEKKRLWLKKAARITQASKICQIG
jgi:hypothetical protein